MLEIFDLESFEIKGKSRLFLMMKMVMIIMMMMIINNSVYCKLVSPRHCSQGSVYVTSCTLHNHPKQ